MKIEQCSTELYLSPCTKFRLKWIKDISIKPTILNLIEEKVGSTFECISTGDHFLNIIPVAQTLKETINKMGPSEIENLLQSKNGNLTKYSTDSMQPP